MYLQYRNAVGLAQARPNYMQVVVNDSHEHKAMIQKAKHAVLDVTLFMQFITLSIHTSIHTHDQVKLWIAKKHVI